MLSSVPPDPFLPCISTSVISRKQVSPMCKLPLQERLLYHPCISWAHNQANMAVDVVILEMSGLRCWDEESIKLSSVLLLKKIMYQFNWWNLRKTCNEEKKVKVTLWMRMPERWYRAWMVQWMTQVPDHYWILINRNICSWVLPITNWIICLTFEIWWVLLYTRYKTSVRY